MPVKKDLCTIVEPTEAEALILQKQFKPAAKDILKDIDLADKKGVDLGFTNLSPPTLVDNTDGAVEQLMLDTKPKKTKGKRKGNGKLAKSKKHWRPMSHSKQQKAKGNKKLSKRKGGRKQGNKRRPKMLRFPGRRRQNKQLSKKNKKAARKLRKLNRKTGLKGSTDSFDNLKVGGKGKRKQRQGKTLTGIISRRRQRKLSKLTAVPKTVTIKPEIKV